MQFDSSDLENICEALHQMEFRCIRNIHLIEDAQLISTDANSQVELSLLRNQLQRCHTSMEKIKLFGNSDQH